MRSFAETARPAQRTIAIVGGGISGLASAVRLVRLGHRIIVFDGEPALGGLGVSFPYQDGNLEKFYHCILPDDFALIGLIQDVGLGSDLLWRPTDMGFMYRRRTYPMNTAMDVMRFDPLTLIDRLRLGMMGVRARFASDRPALDNIAVDDWIRSQIGDRAFQILWRPLLEAKLGDSYPAIPALWLSSRLGREKSTKREVKGCLTGGYQSLVSAIEGTLRDAGAEIRLRTRVARIERHSDGMTVVTDSGDRIEADTVIATSPLAQFQAMTADLDIPDAYRSLTLDYQGVVSGVFLMTEPLTQYYWMPIVDSGATCQGIIEMSNLVPLQRSSGLYVVYCVNYTHRTSELYSTPDSDLLAAYRDDLRNLFPDTGDSVVDQYLFRAPFVEPIWPLGYRAVRPPPSVLPGKLYLASTAQAYPRVNSWNSCVEVVDEMMVALDDDLARASGSGSAAA
jgi:protoporphyrinogen oxidase